SIAFTLRGGISFSDGTPFTSDDVAFTMRQLMNPATHSPTGDAFRTGTGDVVSKATAKDKITITFPAPIAGLDKLFDQVAIMSARSPLKEKAVLGPFVTAEYVPGSHIILRRNPNYWKVDASGKRLPYLDSIRLDIQQNRDLEIMRFRRDEVQLVNALDSEYFDRLMSQSPQAAHDAGPSMDSEEMWFNQVAASPIAPYKREWFRSTNFRRAISSAINRQDLVRIVFNNHATAAAGPVSPANQFWFNSALHPHPFDRAGALNLLSTEGFRLDHGTLRDRSSHPVEFSIITNSGNKSRERMAAMIQQDMAAIGIKVSVVTLDFPALIERITRTFDYDACLLGLVNTDLDPNSQMNIWLSSSENHQWNPSQKSPETAWEAELDRLMRTQASSMDPAVRKLAFDKVQEIVWENEPFIYLVHKNALSAVSTSLVGVTPVVLRPQTFWQADTISMRVEKAAK
ncbi:MAG: ABC transporter substrate-binding protein, partial [Acidobacteriales bacterium]|nr:ABC transporter substrate-binding protein [Terriglobales bacterium]